MIEQQQQKENPPIFQKQIIFSTVMCLSYYYLLCYKTQEAEFSVKIGWSEELPRTSKNLVEADVDQAETIIK